MTRRSRARLGRATGICEDGAASRSPSNVKQNGITGTGLGLAIVKDLVECYEGRLRMAQGDVGGWHFQVEEMIAEDVSPFRE